MTLEIKICGLTNVGDARAALECGADYLGFVLYPKSPRGIAPRRMMDILDRLAAPFRAVAVFVNLPRDEVERIAADAGLHAAQLHGDERAPEFAGTALTLWRAVKRAGGRWQPTPAAWPAARYVVDAAAPGGYGGTGTLADWRAAAVLARRRPSLLAGGLTPDNVAEAIRAVRPAGVDVSSGVERRPGKKDLVKVKAFIEAARGALRR